MTSKTRNSSFDMRALLLAIAIVGGGLLTCGTAPNTADAQEGKQGEAGAGDGKGIDFDEIFFSIRPALSSLFGNIKITPRDESGIGRPYCEYTVVNRPAGDRFPNAHIPHQIERTRVVRLEELLQKTDWLNAPGHDARANYTDGPEYTLTLKRKGTTRTVTIKNQKIEPYKSLVDFLSGIARQENLVYRLQLNSVEERYSTLRKIEQYVRDEQGDPLAKPPVDLRRFLPMLQRYVRFSFRHSNEEIIPAVRLLGHLRSEPDRESIAALANDRDSHIRLEVAEALGNFGGKESLPVLRRMICNTSEAAWELIRLGPLAVPTIVEVIESGTEPFNEQMPDHIDYERMIRSYLTHWIKVPRPVDPRVLEAVRKSMATPNIRKYGTQYHKKLLELAAP